jgi:hypothetical protein
LKRSKFSEEQMAYALRQEFLDRDAAGADQLCGG